MRVRNAFFLASCSILWSNCNLVAIDSAFNLMLFFIVGSAFLHWKVMWLVSNFWKLSSLTVQLLLKKMYNTCTIAIK